MAELDIIPLKDCYLTKEQITNIVISVGNRTDRTTPGTRWRLVWGLPPRYKFMNEELDSTIMNGDDPQAIASHVSEKVADFRMKIEKKILDLDGFVRPDVTLNIILQIRRGSRSEACSNFNYPLTNRPNTARP